MHRYFIFVWDKADSDSARQVEMTRSHLVNASNWESPYGGPGILVLHRPLPRPCVSFRTLANSQGVVLGSLFQRAQDEISGYSRAQLSDTETQRIVESSGRHLVQNYWGTYIAVIHNPSSSTCTVLRDPTANLACFRVTWGNITIFFSDLEDFIRYIRMPLTVNWRYMAARLLAGMSLSRNCGITEIEDIPGGESVNFPTEQRRLLWYPAQFCGEDGLESAHKAVDELRSTVVHVVRALASEHERIMVLLSGGLDSSIVTSALAKRKDQNNVTCVNFYIVSNESTEFAPLNLPGMDMENFAKLRRVSGSADERKFARIVADRCGFRLFERERIVFDLDLSKLSNAPLAPRPSGYVFLCDEDELECSIASATRATACFAGHGGDTVFYATLRAIGASDYAFLHPFGSRHIHHISATARLSRESIVRVIGKVIRYGVLRFPLPPQLDLMKRPHLLIDNVASSVPHDYFEHPWLYRAARLCPGKYNHVVGVAHSVPHYHNIYHRERIAPSINPLAAQPVVETCLRIPTYVLTTGGVSRGLARRAFQHILPPEIARRTVKGTGWAFYQNIVRRNMRLIREQLLDGILVQNFLLDRKKLEAYLTDDQPFLTVQATQIMDYLACETWLAQLSSTKQSGWTTLGDARREAASRVRIGAP